MIEFISTKTSLHIGSPHIFSIFSFSRELKKNNFGHLAFTLESRAILMRKDKI